MAEYNYPLGTGLSADQTIVRAYDETNNRHRVDAQVTAVIGAVDVVIDAASGDNIAIRDSEGDELNVNADGSINVIVQDITLDYTNDSVTVYQGTNPWIVSATDLDIRALTFSEDKVDVSGSSVSISNFPATQNVNVVSSVEVEVKNDAGNPIPVNGTVELGATTLAALESITVQNPAGAGAVNIQDGGNSLTVDATDLDIRNLVFATDKVDASGSAVSVTNFPTTQDVNIVSSVELEIKNDLNNPIPVSANNLDIRDLVFATDKVDVSGSSVSVNNFPATQNVAITSSVELEIKNDSGNPVPVSGTVTANQGTSPWVTSTTNGALETTAQNILTQTTGTNTATTALNGKVNQDFGASSGAVRVAAQLGNATGSAAFGAGATNAQTVRTVIATDQTSIPITDNGGSLTVDGSVTVTQATGTNLHTVVDSGSITVSNGAGASAVNIQDGGNSITVDGSVNAVQSGTWNINNITGTVSLPTGASTSALQTTGNTSLNNIDTKLTDGTQRTKLTDGTNNVAVSNAAPAGTEQGLIVRNIPSGTQNVAVTSSTLPTGAATSANQVTAQSSLTSIDAKTPTLGQTSILANAQPVVQPGDLVLASQNITTQDLASVSSVNANGQVQWTGTPTANSAATFTVPSYHSATLSIKGTWTGTVSVETSIDNGVTWVAKTIHLFGGSYFLSNFTANVQGSVLMSGKTNLRVRGTGAITGTVVVGVTLTVNSSSIYVANSLRIADGSNTAVATPLTVLPASTAATASNTSAVVAISPNTNTVKIGNSAGTFVSDVSPYNRLRVTTEPSTLLADKFDGAVLDPVMWTSSVVGAGTVVIGTGNLSLNTGAATTNGARIQSVPTFQHPGNAFLQFGAAIKLETSLFLNTRRHWGFATGGANTYASPLTDGVVWEVDETGALRATVYNTSVRTFTAVVTAPTNGEFNRFDIFYNTQNISWYINGVLQAQTTTGFNPVTQTLPGRIAIYNNTAAAPAGTPILQSQAIAFTDTAHNNNTISDGTYGFRKAKVSANSDLSVADVANTAGSYGAITVGATATLMTSNGTTALANRKGLTIFNNSLVIIYYGFDNTVTTSTGTPIYPSGSLSIDVGPTITVYAIAGTAGNNTRVTEIS